MTFPATIRAIKVEIQKRDLTWTDVTSDVFGGDRDQIVITRGRTDPSSVSAPASCLFSIQSLTGRYSPRNPNSNLYGEVKRNTPVRVSVTDTGTDYRFTGEFASLAPRQDVSGNDSFVLLEAAGFLRRFGIGTEPAATGLRAFIDESPGLFRYWPLSAETGTAYTLDVAGVGSDHRFTGVRLHYQYGHDFGVPWLGTGMVFYDSTFGPSKAAVGSTDPYVALDFIFQTAELGDFVFGFMDSRGTSYNVNWQSDGDMFYGWTGPGGSPNISIGTTANDAIRDGQTHHARTEWVKSGTDTIVNAYIDGVLVFTGTISPSYVIAGMGTVSFYLTRTGTQASILLGHVAVWSDAASAVWPSAADTAAAAAGYVGEDAGTRIERIAGVAGQTVVFVGTKTDTQLMGPQYSESKLTQIRDAEQADLGILTEPRDQFGLLYRTHRSLYNQTAALTLQYDGNQLAPPFEPTDDDQYTRNDVTVVRRDGDSTRLKQLTGPLSISDPPAGVGRYHDEATMNLEEDWMTAPAAGWLLHLGTLDEARFPRISVDLTNPSVVTAGLDTLVRAVEVGDRIVVQDADAAFFPDDLSLIVLGYTETLDQKHHFFTFNCMPASSYEVFVIQDTGSRISPGEVALTSATMTTTATTMKVLSSDASTLWTTAGGDMPIPVMVNGELMTVTAISGTTPGADQTFTVTRSVNGVVKTHAVGETVRLNRRAVWAF